MSVIVFPGQGSQFLEMSKDFYDNFDTARDVFNLVSDTTNIDVKNIIFKNPSNLLNQTQYTQLAIFCASISIFKVIEKEADLGKLNINYMLGHSLGEYTALAASGMLSIENCSLLLKIRGELMQNAYEPNKSGMAAIIGINSQIAEKIIKQHNLNIEIANDNSPQQIVISGIKSDLLNSEKIFKECGAKKFILLNVSAAFHSPLMNEAEKKMKEFILNTEFKESLISIISNYSGKISNNRKEVLDSLMKQMSNRVRWVESINSLKEINETNIIEIGPGKVLSGLIRRIDDIFDIKSIDKILDIEKI
tara:strand:- start:96 stop:1013 length:918 start_codon:yes stop_codon:yes gene_type:complete